VLRNITLVARRKLASLIDYRALHILGYARRPEVPQCLAFTYNAPVSCRRSTFR
jgi:hypothetical protein